MRMSPWLLVLALATGCRAPATAVTASSPACVLGEATEVIPVEDPRPGELNEFFDLPDSPAWWAPAPMDAERERYRAALLARLGEEGLRQRALMERQHALHTALVGKPIQREAENSGRVLAGDTGQQSPASCLEWRLLQRQGRRFPLLEHPTELGAYLLRGHGRLRVYLSGMGSAGGPLRHQVRDRVVRDVKDGFEPVAHLHNHPFMFDRVPGDRLYTTEDTRADIGGALAPSLTDVQAWRGMREHFGLRAGWLTNGLDSLHYPAEDFALLSAWE